MSWLPSTDTVTGYSVYYGDTTITINNHSGDYDIAAGEIDPTAPSVQYGVVSDLGLRSGEQVCFSVRAYNDYGVSDYSIPACATIN